ncbi:MAG: tetratricopeptide repeat protein [Actinobacteria bacterium]|nr:MAG: tetratricopeptide repeat protein [Actinomycetota bacterium]
MVARGDPAAARPWAAYACAAARRLFGPHDERAIAAAATLAAVLHRVGSHARAIHLYREVITELSTIDGPTSLRVLAAHADLATVEYARGQCETARRRLRQAWQVHQATHGLGHPAGIKMLARLGTMQRDCGRSAEAQQSLTRARELSRAHLSPEHPLAIQIEALTETPGGREHTCEPAGASGAAEPFPWPASPPDSAQRTPQEAQAAPAPAETAGSEAGQADTGQAETAAETSAARTAEPTKTQPITPVDLYPLLDPSPPPSSRRAAAPPEPIDPESWWPPELTGLITPQADEANAPESGPASPSAPNPSSPPPPSAPPPSAPPSVAPPSGAPPHAPPPSNQRPPAPPRLRVGGVASSSPARPTQPIVTAALVVILVIAITVIVGLVISTGDKPASSGAPALSPSPATAALSPAGEISTPLDSSLSPGAPPTNLQLRDNRDNVALSWTYPPGAEGPVLIAGGRRGQQPRVFQELPPGTASYVAYGLNGDMDYCFTVAVVYSTELIGRSGPVCTNRK